MPSNNELPPPVSKGHAFLNRLQVLAANVFNRRTLNYLMILAAIALVVWLLIRSAGIFTFNWLFHKYYATFTGLGVGRFTATLIAVGIALGIVYGISLLLRRPRFLFGASRAQAAAALVIVFLAGYHVAVGYYEKDFRFTPTGEAEVCFARDLDGRYVPAPCGWKFHRAFGTPVERATPELVRKMHLKPAGVREVEPDADYPLFDPVDGSPRLWYSIVEGRYHFYDAAAHEKRSGEALKPVTPAVLKAHLDRKPDGQRLGATGGSGLRELIDELKKTN